MFQQAFLVCLMLWLSQINTVFSAASVPALLWSPEKSMSDVGSVNNIASNIKSDDFLQDYLQPLMKSSQQSAVVFLQDKLSIDDFTQYADVYSLDSDGGAFKNIKSLMADHFSLELPHVADPHMAVDELKNAFPGDIFTVGSLSEVEKLDLTSGKRFLLLVNLGSVNSHKGKEEALKQNDQLIGSVCHHLKKRGISYSALYTAKSAGGITQNAEGSFSNRHLLVDASGSANGTFMNASDGQIYIYLREVNICTKSEKTPPQGCDKNLTLIPTNDTASSSKRNNNTAEIVLKFKDGSDDIEIKTDAKLMGDRWVMSRMSLHMSGDKNGSLSNATLSPGDIDFVVPAVYSFHCTDMKLFVDKSVKDAKGSYVRLQGYQVQPFNIPKNAKFFNAQDCVGFFTPAIWMGLFPVAILLGILLFGTLMVLNLSIMDRYDDPKGKTIIIPQVSD